MSIRPIVLAAVLLAAATASSGCKSSSPQSRDGAPTEATAETADGEKSARELFVRGNQHLDDEQWKRAISSYEAALEQNSDRWKIHHNLGVAHTANNDFEEAIGAFENALTRGGDADPDLYYNLGNAYQRRGLYDQALKAYRTSLSYRDELEVDTLVNIASTLTVIGARDQAHEAYERARTIEPRDPRIHHGLAILRYLDDEPKQALEVYSRLHSMDADYAPAYYDKARPLADLERWDEAIEALETYLELAPDGDYADKAQGRIEIYRDKLEPNDPR